MPTQLIAEQQDDDPSPTDSFSHATTPSPRSRLTLRRPSNVLAIPPPNTSAKLRNAAAARPDVLAAMLTNVSAWADTVTRSRALESLCP